MSGGRRWRRILLGEAGPAPALILAGVTVVIALIVIAGPRALAAAGNRALAQAAAAAPTLDTGVLVTADQHVGQAGTGKAVGLSAATVAALGRTFGRQLAVTGRYGTGRNWGGFIVPSRTILLAGPPPQGRRQTIEVAFRADLAAHSAMVAGRMPSGPAAIKRGPGGRTRLITIGVAVSKATAATFRLHPGSVVDLSPLAPGNPPSQLLVTGIFRPTGQSAAFWQQAPELPAPALMGPPTRPYWLAGAFTGAGQLAGLQAAYAGAQERAAWFYPLATGRLTRAAVPGIESAVAALSSSPRIGAAEIAAGAPDLRDTAVSIGLANGLATFDSQWNSTSGADSVLVTGLFAVGLALLLTCSGLAARAYHPELALLRVRGGSVAQVGRRTLARSALIAIPAFAAGAAAAIAVVRAGGPAGLVLGLVTGVTAVTATPAICMLQHRRARIEPAANRSRAPSRRFGVRRLVAELAVLAVAVAALADVRFTSAAGGSGGTTGPYLSASAVLVAVSVGLVLNRCYPRPLRGLARASATRPGAVGAVSLANAASRPAAAALPALAIMLSLTLTAFSAMVLASITTGQVAGSWQRVGADALVSAPGTASFTDANLNAISHVPGVRRAAAVFTWPNSGTAGAVLQRGGQSHPASLALVQPRSYAALSATTPWPRFPARALASRTGLVPVLVSPSLAAEVGGPGAVWRLNVFGQQASVRIVGTLIKTPAIPGGGKFLVAPLWAGVRMGLPGPETMLVTGPVRGAALRAAAVRILPGSHVTLRSRVLSGLNSSPALRTSRGLYRTGTLAAAVLTALAVLFWLMASARDRARLLTRLGALGMAGRQALVLGIADAGPLLAVTVAGAAASVWLLAGVIGPVLGLNTFTGSRFPVALRPTWADLGLPVAGAIVLAVLVLLADGARSRRRNLATELRHEEVS